MGNNVVKESADWTEGGSPMKMQPAPFPDRDGGETPAMGVSVLAAIGGNEAIAMERVAGRLKGFEAGTAAPGSG